MIHIHDKEVNKIGECNLLYYIINPPKGAKSVNSYYSPIIHECMNNIHGRAKFKSFRILLETRFSSTIVMGGIVKKLHPEKYSVMQWHTQAGNITTDYKVKVDFTLPALSTKIFVM